MSDDWAKNIAEKIQGFNSKPHLDERSTQIAKFAEEARGEAAEILFKLFTDKVDAICHQLEKAEGESGWLKIFRKRPPAIINYTMEEELTFRFQMREAYGSRLTINYQRGNQPTLKIDVATYELIDGNYLPIFRDSGAIAGAQIWQENNSERKHPELKARLFLILSAAAVEENLKVSDAVSWVYETENKRFTSQSAQSLIENLINIA